MSRDQVGLTGERKDLAVKIPKLIRFDTSKVQRLTLNLPVRTTIKLVPNEDKF